MKTESIVLSIIAIIIGLVVAGVAFYFFQMSQNKPKEENHIISVQTSPTPEEKKSFLTITSPEDESLSTSKEISITGTAPVGATIVIATENGQDVYQTNEKGEFTADVTLDTGVNVISITGLLEDGTTDTTTRTISYTTENF